MTGEPVARMVNLSNGHVIGGLDAAQLGFLRKHLQQESETDTSFFFDPETAEWMREEGAAELASLLQNEMGSASELFVGIAPELRNAPGRVRGRLLALESQSPLAGYKIEALDHHLFSNRLLGWNYSDAEGRFEVPFGDTALGHRRLSSHAESQPDVKLRITNSIGADAPANSGSTSFPGVGGSQSAADELVTRSGAPPIQSDAELSGIATPTQNNKVDDQGSIAGGSAEDIALEDVQEEALAMSDGDNLDDAVFEEEVGTITGMETEWGDILVTRGGKLIAPVLDGAAAICPQCGSTYDRGITTCGECHVELFSVS